MEDFWSVNFWQKLKSMAELDITGQDDMFEAFYLSNKSLICV